MNMKAIFTVKNTTYEIVKIRPHCFLSSVHYWDTPKDLPESDGFMSIIYKLCKRIHTFGIHTGISERENIFDNFICSFD